MKPIRLNTNDLKKPVQSDNVNWGEKSKIICFLQEIHFKFKKQIKSKILEKVDRMDINQKRGGVAVLISK